nr:HNH endonuclease [Ruminococcus sp. HUN007]
MVKNYLDNYEKYGQTIVFTVGKEHAVALNKLFNEKGKKLGIKSDFIVSDIRDEATGITISNKDNERKIDSYRNGDIQVLINVNILTEGTDLPQTHTVFLARPTVSRVLMTQMVGRALRGEKAKGTKEAYIVSFIDNWHDKIAWVNPKILSDEEYFEKDDIHNSRDTQVRWISISKLEEFAMMADSNVDTSRLDSIPMIERIPLGMYLLKMDDATYTILIYSSNKEAYSSLIADLKAREFVNEFTEESMNEMIDICMEKYFSEDLIPQCKRSDIEHLIKYFAERPFEPLFITLDELDRKKLDASDVAKYIYENDLSRKSEREYIDKLWNEDGSVVPVYFSNQYFFKKMIEIELDKLNGYIKVSNVEPQSQSEIIEARKLSLYDLIQRFPKTGIELREKVYNKAKNAAGQYVCACCKKVFDTRQFLHVDHIVPMSKGGLTEEDNLQVLCRTCNMQKGDK